MAICRWCLVVVLAGVVPAACGGGVTGAKTDVGGVSDSADAVHTDSASGLGDHGTGAADGWELSEGLLLDLEQGEIPLVEGGFGWPCLDGKECLSGFCAMHMGALVCTQDCVEECPEGWECRLFSGFGDPIFLCISKLANLCRPCSGDGDCKAQGTGDSCIDYGLEGSFCGGKCEGDSDCPSGYHCADAFSLAGVASRECLADAGVCSCTAEAVAAAAWTPCSAGNRWGKCPGKRVCTADGLSGCDAPIPAAENCDGGDDDCDGLVDEGTCDDGDPCSIDLCDPATGCLHEPVEDGTACPLPDSCAASASCKAGVCVAAPLKCPSDNSHCTDDICLPGVGCVHQYTDQAFDCTGGIGHNCEELQDDDLCNGSWKCLACQCQAVGEVDCAPPTGVDAPCQLAICDPATGKCQVIPNPAADGQSCDPDNLCQLGRSCLAGLCQGGALADCDDGLDCTLDSCDPAVGCLHQPVHSLCDDGFLCTVEQCDQALGCLTKLDLPACDDGNDCTEDSCAEGQGCLHLPLADGSPCDDGSLCTEPDSCLAGTCAGVSSDLLCESACPAAGLHGCVSGAGCLCALTTAEVSGAPLGAGGCLAKSVALCLTADLLAGLPLPEEGLLSASGSYRIDQLWFVQEGEGQ